MMYANQVCKDEKLKLAINLTFAGSLRIGEALGLTWDCEDISDEAIARVLSNPQMMAILAAMSKVMSSDS